MRYDQPMREFGKRLCPVGFVLLAIACHGNPDDGDLDQARLDGACDAWCEIAVPCSEHYALQWQFTNQDECEDRCVTHVEQAILAYDESCFDIVLDDRECAADLACESFQAYENFAFGEPYGPQVGCVEEVQLRQAECN